MNRSTSLSVLVLFLGSIAMQAQTPPPPEAPFLLPDSRNAQWVIQVQGLPDKPTKQTPGNGQNIPGAPETAATPPPAAGGRNLKQIEVIRSNNLLRRINTWANGTQTEKWWQGAYLLLKEPDYSTVFIVPWESILLSEETYEQFSNTNFPELRWVNASTFLEWTTVGDRQVAVYGQKQSDADAIEMRGEATLNKIAEERTGIKPKPADPATRRPTSRDGFARLAWIDGQSKRPIAMESARSRWTYTFTDGEIAAIELPPGFREAIGRYLEAANVQKLDVKP
ncbi:MAG: hypothetical protein WCQ57_03090 [Verrucomicrobiota bacterium]